MSAGIRYLVVALGGPDEPATDADVDALHELLSDRLAPFTVTPLSERTSDRLTAVLLLEATSVTP